MIASCSVSVALLFSLLAGIPQATQTETGAGTTLPQLPPARQFEQRGDVLMARKLYRDASDAYAQALKLEPRNEVLLNKMGISFHQQLRMEEAKRYYDRSIHANRNYAEAYNNLGTVYYARRNYKKAIKYFSKALALKPTAASFHANLAMGYFARKRIPEAVEEFKTAISLDPEVLNVHHGFGTVLQERTVEERGFFNFVVAKAFAASGNLDLCLEYLRKAFEDGFRDVKRIEADPDFARVRLTQQFKELLQRLPPPLEP